MVCPERRERLLAVAEESGLVLQGPQHAFLIQGDDELGALVDIHLRLYQAQISVHSSNGVSDARGGYGYLAHVRSQDCERAAQVLGV